MKKKGGVNRQDHCFLTEEKKKSLHPIHVGEKGLIESSMLGRSLLPRREEDPSEIFATREPFFVGGIRERGKKNSSCGERSKRGDLRIRREGFY